MKDDRLPVTKIIRTIGIPDSKEVETIMDLVGIADQCTTKLGEVLTLMTGIKMPDESHPNGYMAIAKANLASFSANILGYRLHSVVTDPEKIRGSLSVDLPSGYTDFNFDGDRLDPNDLYALSRSEDREKRIFDLFGTPILGYEQKQVRLGSLLKDKRIATVLTYEVDARSQVKPNPEPMSFIYNASKIAVIDRTVSTTSPDAIKIFTEKDMKRLEGRLNLIFTN
ncbi:MAG TPA: hypothetical protein VJI68_02825 [Candidatus Nanoarchaeia archaeon]|nr:hypothetical protein [Candidatus Nanoarchaeia archaeon]